VSMHRGFGNPWVLVLVCALVYGALSFLTGILPGIAFSRIPPTPGLRPYTAAERRGRDVYVAEGCAYCHSQNVRPFQEDRVFGRPSVAGDYAYDTPELLGDHRNGPDLTDIGARQPSAVWQYIHLYEPRALVSASIMPAYPWLFRVKPTAAPGDVVVPVPSPWGPRHGVVVATARARDLVTYLLSLKQVPLPTSSAPPGGVTP
jgi:cytochrome c oxidase cbb3-type subunit 2